MTNVQCLHFIADKDHSVDKVAKLAYFLCDERTRCASCGFPAHYAGGYQQAYQGIMWEVALTTSIEDQIVNLWEIRTGTVLYSYKTNRAAVNSLSLVGQDYFISAQEGKPNVQFYSWHKDHPVVRSSIPEKVGAIVVSHDGLYCVAGGVSGSCYLWEVSTGNLLKTWSTHYSKVTALAFTGDGGYLVSGGEDGMVHVWAITSILDKKTNAIGEQMHVAPYRTFSNHTLPITSLTCGLGCLNTRIFSSSLDRSVKIWEISGNRLLGQVVLPTFATCAIVNPLETSVFAGCGDGNSANIYQVDIINCIEGGLTNTHKIFKAHSKQVQALGTSFDGTQLISAGADGRCIVWDVHSRLPLREMGSHKGPVTNLIMMLNPLQTDPTPVKLQMKPLQKFLTFDDASTKSTQKPDSEKRYVTVDLGGEEDEMERKKRKKRKMVDGNEGVLKEVSGLINDKGSYAVITQLRTEVEDLTALNSRWQDVSSKLFEKCEDQLLKNVVS